MKKWKLYTIVSLIIVFVGTNLFLLLKENSKADRQTYIADWAVVKKDDVTKTFETKGVVQPEKENYVFYDKEVGHLASFQVKEGDVISPGTPLFTYGTKELEDEQAEIESEITQINEEISSIDSQIDELESIDSYTGDSSSTQTVDEKANVSVDVNVDVSSIVAGDIEKAIIEAEAERERLEAKLSKYESDLTRVEEKISDVAVLSEIDGQVININENIQNPVITIASSSLAVEGVLSEEQMKQAKEQQEVFMYSSLHDKKYKGTVDRIVSFPNKAPAIEQKSEYPVIVQIENADEKLLPGAKLSMKIVVDKAENVPVISETSVFKEGKATHVFQMTKKGTVERQKVVKGLAFKGKQEIQNGLKAGDVIAKKPKEIKVYETTFITPMKTNHIEKKNIKKLSKKQILKYTLIGFLEK